MRDRGRDETLVVEGDEEALDGTIKAVNELLAELERFRARYVGQGRRANGTIPVVDLGGGTAFDKDVVMGIVDRERSTTMMGELGETDKERWRARSMRGGRDGIDRDWGVEKPRWVEEAWTDEDRGRRRLDASCQSTSRWTRV